MKWFYNLKLSTKLLLSFLLVSGSAVIVGYQGLRSTSQVAKASDEMYNNAFVAVRELAASRGAFLDARIRSRTMVSVNTEEERRQMNEIFQADMLKIDEHMKSYQALPLDETQKSILPKLLENLSEYRREIEPAFPLALAKKDQEAEKIMNGRARQLSADAAGEYQQLLEINDRFAETRQKSNQAMADSAAKSIIVFGALGVLAAFGLGWLLTRIIAVPIKQLQVASARAANGDVNVKIDIPSRDEVGELGRGFTELLGMIKRRAEVAQKIAEGQLDLNLTAASENDVLGKSLKSVTETLNALMRELGRMSDAHDAGDIDARVDDTKFQGAYNVVAKGINNMVAGHIIVKKKAMACVAEFGKGNFEAPLDQFPGKKAFINDTIEQVRTKLKSLIADTQALSDAAIHGRLGYRADSQRHTEIFARLWTA